MFKKIILAVLLVLFMPLKSFAGDIPTAIGNILNSFDFERDSVVSISVKDKQTGEPLYQKDSFKYLNPASALKLFTMTAAAGTLGENYNFETSFYKDAKGNLYLKLSGDPMLTEKDLNTLAKNLAKNYKGKPKTVYIDDSILDNVSYPDGWTIDDYWPNSPKISSYMVDNNTVKVDFYLNSNKNVEIFQKDSYKFSFVNKLVYGNKTDITLSIDDIHNTVNAEGTVSKSVMGKEIPVLNPKYFFCKKMNTILNANGVTYTDNFLFEKVPAGAVKIATFSRPLNEVIKHTLTTSDNTAAETVFKVAGAKFAGNNAKGTTQAGVDMFLNYYENLGLDVSQIKVRDGSGVSRYNALSTDWMTSALSKTDIDYTKYLPTAGVGTLSKRMRELKNKVWLKTGTLTGLSALVGIIKPENDKEYYYSSIIMNYNRNQSLIKGIEDDIVFEIYRKNED